MTKIVDQAIVFFHDLSGGKLFGGEGITHMNGIEVNPRVCNGKPVISGTRIPVTVILDQFASGCSMADIQRKYPELSVDQIASALHYCHTMIDHSDLQAVPA